MTIMHIRNGAQRTSTKSKNEYAGVECMKPRQTPYFFTTRRYSLVFEFRNSVVRGHDVGVCSFERQHSVHEEIMVCERIPLVTRPSTKRV